MTRSEALHAAAQTIESETGCTYTEAEHAALQLFYVIDKVLRFEPEIANFSGTATAVSKVK